MNKKKAKAIQMAAEARTKGQGPSHFTGAASTCVDQHNKSQKRKKRR